MRAHQRGLREDEIRQLGGLLITSPARTFLDLAGVLPLNTLTAVGDRMVSRRAPLVTKADLETYVAESSGRGVGLARHALTLIDDGSESPKETELRLVLLGAGFSPLVSNHSVFDPDGRFVARVDLAIVGLRIAIEYEGDHHRDPAQWRRDIARRRRLEALGWTYIPVTQAGLVDPRSLVADVRAAIARRS